ncbi:MAG: hypothetical protein V3S69_02030 [Dehalococcoidales bacterium]
MSMQYNMSKEQEKRILALLNGHSNKTVNEKIAQVVNQGLYALEYRIKQNLLKKEGAALLKRAQADPELARKLGLAAAVELNSVRFINKR